MKSTYKSIHLLRENAAYQRIGEIFSNPLTLVFLIFAMAIDYSFQYPVTELMFTQAAWLSIFNAITFAFAIDATPLIMSSSLLHLMDKPDKAEFKKELVLFFIAALFFVATFVLGALLKFSLMEQLFAGAASLTPSTLVEGQEAAPYEPSNAEICMVCIQSCVQFATSLFLFALGMQKSLKQQREDAKETLILRATENRLHIDSEIAELVRAGEFDLDALEIQKLEQTKEHIDREASLQKTVARKVLAQSLKNKEASTYLLEE